MKTKHYLTINEPDVVQLHGFENIADYIYVEIFEEKKNILFMTKKRPLKVNCFEVVVNEDRKIYSVTLYNLVREYSLMNKRFWPDEKFKHYLSTDIDI